MAEGVKRGFGVADPEEGFDMLRIECGDGVELRS